MTALINKGHQHHWDLTLWYDTASRLSTAPMRVEWYCACGSTRPAALTIHGIPEPPS